VTGGEDPSGNGVYVCDKAFRKLKNVKFVKYHLTENGLKEMNRTLMVQE